MAQNADEEVRVFRDFVGKAGLPVDLDSIERRKPPQPDILCCTRDGEWVAFELVEVCVRENAAFMGRAPVVADLIQETYSTLSPEQRTRFDARFAGIPLSFEFNQKASTNLIRDLLPRTLSELADQPQYAEVFTFSSAVQRALASVRTRGRVEAPSRPAFNIAGFFRPDDVVVDTVASKLGKIHVTPHPIELLAYFANRAFDDGVNRWENSLRETLESRGLGQFRRVWIKGWDTVRVVYPNMLGGVPS